MNKLKGAITITKPTYLDVEKVIITLNDKNSVHDFIEVEVEAQDFLRAVMGQARIPVMFSTSNLQNVGLKKVQKSLEFPIPNNENKQWAELHAQEFADNGWVASTYMGSRDSTFMKNGQFYARTTQYKFITQEEFDKAFSRIFQNTEDSQGISDK